MLRITDTGVGIPPAQLKRVFHRFLPCDEPGERAHQGHRPGPVHCKRHRAPAWRRDASAQSYGPGHGTTITVHLPLLARVCAAACTRGKSA